VVAVAAAPLSASLQLCSASTDGLQQRSRLQREGGRLLAGVLSAVVARTAVAPLERLKLEYMLNHSALSVARNCVQILRTEGVAGFWMGNGLNLLRTVPYKALNYYCFDTYRHVLADSINVRPEHAAGLAGAAAGVTSVITCFPLDLVRTRLMVRGGRERYKSLLGALRRVSREEGFGALYRGLLPAVLSMAPNGAVYYGVYDALKASRAQERAQRSGDGSDDALELWHTLLHGGLAGAAAEFSTYPLEVVRRHLQLETTKGGRKGVGGMVVAVAAIRRAEGWRGFYAGILPSVLQVLPSAALSYYTFELFKSVFKVDDDRARKGTVIAIAA